MYVDENNVAHFTVDELKADFGKAANVVARAWERFKVYDAEKPLVTSQQLVSLIAFLAEHFDGFEDKVEEWAKGFKP